MFMLSLVWPLRSCSIFARARRWPRLSTGSSTPSCALNCLHLNSLVSNSVLIVSTRSPGRGRKRSPIQRASQGSLFSFAPGRKIMASLSRKKIGASLASTGSCSPSFQTFTFTRCARCVWAVPHHACAKGAEVSALLRDGPGGRPMPSGRRCPANNISMRDRVNVEKSWVLSLARSMV